MNKMKLGLITPFIMASVLASTDLHAETSAGFIIEEVIVTARKREENLQDTPVAVSAFTSNELTLRNIKSTDQLGDITPNLTFDAYAPSSGSNSSSQIFIRGIGQTDFTAVTDPGVGLYVDGVYYSRSIGGSVDFLDLERVEILRGPQGTLFGRNTIGGAVALHTRRPAEEFGGSVEVEVGNDNMRNIAADFDMPISATLLSKISLASRKRDGYVKRAFDGKELGDDDVTAGRLALQWMPSNSFDVFLTADYTKEREQGAPSSSLGVNDQGAFAMLTNVFLIPACPLAPPPKPPGPARDTMNNPNCLNFSRNKGPYVSEGTAEVASELDYWGMSITANWEVNEYLSIKSITAYRDMDAYSARDADNTEFQVFHTQDTFKHEQLSQEFQFSGLTLDSSLKWLLGLYYFEEAANNPNPVQLPVPFVGSFISGGQTDNDNFAVFGQATWDITDQLHLTFGLRFTDETKRFSPYSFIPDGRFYVKGGPGSPAVRFFACPTGSEAGCGGVAGRRFTPGDRLIPEAEYEKKFSDWTPMANIAYEINDDVMVYFTYSQGFKSGGFDQRYNVEFLDGPTSFDPETATTLELGTKSTWLNNRLRLNVAAFFTDYKDQHIIIREGFAPITFNAGESDIRGIEIEASFVPTDAWIVQASVGYIDAEYSKLNPTVVENGGITKDSSFAQTPKLSANIGIAYTRYIGSFGTITPRVDWSYKSASFNDAINTPQLRQGSYHLLNGSMSFLSANEKWEVILSGRNINSELYLITGNSALTTGASYAEGIWARQTEWSLSVQYSF